MGDVRGGFVSIALALVASALPTMAAWSAELLSKDALPSDPSEQRLMAAIDRYASAPSAELKLDRQNDFYAPCSKDAGDCKPRCLKAAEDEFRDTLRGKVSASFSGIDDVRVACKQHLGDDANASALRECCMKGFVAARVTLTRLLASAKEADGVETPGLPNCGRDYERGKSMGRKCELCETPVMLRAPVCYLHGFDVGLETCRDRKPAPASSARVEDLLKISDRDEKTKRDLRTQDEASGALNSGGGR